MQISVRYPNEVEADVMVHSDTVEVRPLFFAGSKRAPVVYLLIEDDAGQVHRARLVVHRDTGRLALQELKPAESVSPATPSTSETQARCITDGG